MARKAWLGFLVGLMVASLAVAFTAAPGNAAAKKIYRVEARTTTFGGSSYILGFAFCDLLNKHSTWVRGAVLESTGSAENIKLVGQDPKKRTRTFFTCTAELFERARKGLPPFQQNAQAYKKLMIMANQQQLIGTLITLDPKIKTLADLKGKRVATWPRGTQKFEATYNLIGGAGKEVLDSIKWQFTGYAGYNDMILGKTDAAFTFCPETGPGVFTTVPKLKELMSKRKVYFVTATGKMRRLSEKLYGVMYGLTSTMPAGVLGQGVPAQKVLGMNMVLGWGVYPEMPAEVVYEILKIMDEQSGQVKTYHSAGKGWLRAKYGAYPVPKEDFHPGARKFYEEKGIPYGDKYFFKLYPVD
ncbi:MAG: TAXI family TRAP transporter solute-binding subunit [Thermodesulfobacteriota bacterium]